MIREVKYADFIEEKPVIRDWIDEHGREVLDKTPVAIPLRMPQAPQSMMQLIHQLYRDMDPKNVETFEDAEDFDVPDELGIEMMDTPYEQDFDHIKSRPAPAESPSAVPAEPEKVTE